jgi:hypothetical protein
MRDQRGHWRATPFGERLVLDWPDLPAATLKGRP